MKATKIRGTGGAVRHWVDGDQLFRDLLAAAPHPGLETLTPEELQDTRQAICDAVKWYDALSGEAMTATEIMHSLKRIRNCARQLAARRTSEVWCERLGDALAVSRRKGRSLVYQQVARAACPSWPGDTGSGRELPRLGNNLDFGPTNLTDDDWLVVDRLAAIDPQRGLPPPRAERYSHRAPGRDPELLYLVKALKPAFERVTGKSVKAKTKRPAEVRVSPLKRWMDVIARHVGIQPPSHDKLDHVVRQLEATKNKKPHRPHD